MNASRARVRRFTSAAAVVSAALVLSATAGGGTPGALAPAAATTAAATAATPATAAAAVAGDHRPNIVMIMTDDMRVDDLRFMPQVRRLIKNRGLEFENSFSPYPLCCPARASFLTGRYAHNHHVLSHQKPYGFAAFDDSRTLATALRRSGYNTGFIGKYLNNYGNVRSKVTGRSSLHYVPAGWTDWHAGVENSRFAESNPLAGGTYAYFDTTFNVNGRLEPHQGQYQTTVLGQKTRQLVGKYSKSAKPFFIYLSSVAPHHGAPREPDDPKPVRGRDGRLTSFVTPARPDWVKGRFDRVVTRAPGLPRAGGPTEADMSDKPRYLRRLPEPNAAERRAMVEVTRQRAEALFVVDREVERIVARLKSAGEYDNTILMFTSDNGYFLGEHRVLSGKVKPHEPSLRVPFLISGPGIARGQTRYDPITTVDVSATVAGFARATDWMPYALDGMSKVSTIRHGDNGWTRPVITEALMTELRPYEKAADIGFTDARSSIGIRTARYKYIRYSTGETELYDLDVDPNEMDSLQDDPAYAEVESGLDALWWQYKDCKGATCRAAMPAEFRTGAAALRRDTRQQWAGWNARYGS